MAFNATQTAAEDAFRRLRTQAGASRTYLQGQRALMVAPTCSALVPLAVIQHFASVIDLMTTLAQTPGLAAYARAQFDDPGYDVAAEFLAMRTAMVSTRDSLIDLFPKDGNGFLLYQTISPTGALGARTFTAAQVAPAVALIDTVITTIA